MTISQCLDGLAERVSCLERESESVIKMLKDISIKVNCTEATDTKWIKISDKKPRNDSRVLVAVLDSKYKFRAHNIYIGIWFNNTWIEEVHEKPLLRDSQEVTHWMQLPYTPEDEE